jgi:hypothetical protein
VKPLLLSLWLVGAAFVVLFAGSEPTVEERTLRYPLPDELVTSGGKPVESKDDWYKIRRPELMALFSENVYGRTPTSKPHVHYSTPAIDDHALGGTAIRKQVTVFFSPDEHGPQMKLLVYVPARAHRPVPVIVGLNFAGNHTVSHDPGIELGHIWNNRARHRADEISRGKAANQWQIDKILAQGYALATVYYGDIEPDFPGGIKHGVRPLYFAKGQTKPAPNEWGAIGAWAWGLSRVVDYLETDRSIDSGKVVLFGFSRLGKAALWSAAQDERFQAVLSNESGKGGASLYRANSGETIEHLNTAFPHWFCGNFHQYTRHPDRVPVDGNLLLSLIAPRPLYIGSAEGDTSSAPNAEFLSEVRASRVYQLLGKPGLPTDQMPPVNHALNGWLGYHDRAGKHDVTAYDWEQYLRFADARLGRSDTAHLASMAKQ